MCVGEKRALVVPNVNDGNEKHIPSAPAGAILRYEIECHGIVLENFFVIIDTDNSGDLTADELTAWLEEHHDDMSAGAPAAADMLKEILQDEDTNGDGIIQFEEFSGPKGEKRGARSEEL